MSNLIPLHDNVIVEPLAAETMTASGIVIPETASKEKPMRGKVLSVGPGKDDEPMPVKAGDIVVYSQYAPTEIKIEGKEFYIIESKSLLAIEK
jgi:chaperonin GroES